ncbi:uncharacterized protein A4U43_C01F36170 [Asparagus officinalis]|uniref:Uncharacterized protein n=1 Tax=Asparagus officinalis TaxID=4686 RepID=A0A5P1FUV7_ASPOF|nr:uncharacterized protein A4U43_C01F36170 [Asparagus officinalis]
MYSAIRRSKWDPAPDQTRYYSTTTPSASVDLHSLSLALLQPATLIPPLLPSAMLINRSSPNSLCWDINNISADQPRAQRCYPSTATAPAFRSPAVNPASASSSNLGGSDPLLLARRVRAKEAGIFIRGRKGVERRVIAMRPMRKNTRTRLETRLGISFELEDDIEDEIGDETSSSTTRLATSSTTKSELRSEKMRSENGEEIGDELSDEIDN